VISSSFCFSCPSRSFISAEVKVDCTTGAFISLGARDLFRVSALVNVYLRGVLPPTEAVALPGGTFFVKVSALGSLAVPASLDADGARLVLGSTNGCVIAGLLESDSTGF